MATTVFVVNAKREGPKLENQDYPFRCSVALGRFPLELPKKSRSIYCPTGFSENFL